MARPIKTGLSYFPHDVDALSDEKIQSLKVLYRNDGYAFYFIILERIYRTPKGELDISSSDEKRILAKSIGISLKKFDTILQNCFKKNLFSEKRFSKHGVLTSTAIKRRFLQIQSERQRKRNWYNKSKVSFRRPLDVKDSGETTGETPQSKVKHILIELAKLIIERIEKETVLHSVIGKYYNSLGADKLTKILTDCKGRGKIFTTENNLAAYLQACEQNNGKLTDNLPEIKEGTEKWMQ
ncbi:MAG: hypothetical protein A2455_05200 [Ignavibacteria bacterium RIFOXYC2_FULL_35_16]|nr:MAG: hypothetical protein A2455_05200 [Ignavibacteria bacterium RIFOXYC2_FULL_35_16]